MRVRLLGGSLRWLGRFLRRIGRCLRIVGKLARSASKRATVTRDAVTTRKETDEVRTAVAATDARLSASIAGEEILACWRASVSAVDGHLIAVATRLRRSVAAAIVAWASIARNAVATRTKADEVRTTVAATIAGLSASVAREGILAGRWAAILAVNGHLVAVAT